MYKIDKTANRINRLESKRFSDLGFSERSHLQEWLANEPDALGEELLIIQKEFDGFDDTRERLDLLALDKDGNIVVIENKLDDTGRDVVWQALKYASYCSGFTRSQIIEIYQAYLDKYCSGGDAGNFISEFLEIPDIDEAVLNSGNDQRIMLVAANFRKEVTSTALWLISHGINIQCFKVTPYSLEEQLFLNVEQIIPTPEAKELMIGMAAKNADEKNNEKKQLNSHIMRLEFWELALEELRNSNCDLFNNISPGKDHWLDAGSGMSGVPYTLIFGKDVIRVELSITRPDLCENKRIFDLLYNQKEIIEKDFQDFLIWERLDNKKSSRVKFSKKVDGYNKDNWPEMIKWLIGHISRLEKAFKKPLQQINTDIKQKNFNPEL
ncbi:MAG: DUF4268 domain-containing protein [Desulfobacteraceae bacterium]|nr:DUF4268 domain-containing protein [Desulfobacteraceae bacterium]